MIRNALLPPYNNKGRMGDNVIGIYKITNQITKMVYIGQSVDIQRRWREHRVKYKSKDTLLYQAMRLYGINNFTFEILEECKAEELNSKEKYYIQQYNTLEEGYNMSVIENLQGKINWSMVELILLDLKANSLTISKIAEKYSVSPSLISQINHGKMWKRNGVCYPIRPIFVKEDKKAVSRRKVERPSREELKVLIRENSFLQLGKQFGVSDNAIRKWCKAYDLPYKSTEIKRYSDKDWENI